MAGSGKEQEHSVWLMPQKMRQAIRKPLKFKSTTLPPIACVDALFIDKNF